MSSVTITPPDRPPPPSTPPPAQDPGRGAPAAVATGEALALGRLRASRDEFMLVVVPSAARAESLLAEWRFFAGEAAAGIAVFPDSEVLPYDTFSPHQDLISQRLTVLRDLCADRLRTLIVPAASLIARLPPRHYLAAYGFDLRPGQRLAPAQLRRQLEDAGYQRVSQVGEHGEYAVRGSLVDFFPMGSEAPVRVDFLDDEVGQLRWFDPETQRSAGVADQLSTLPARELPTDAAAIRRFRQAWRQRFEGNPGQSLVYREVSDGRLPGGIENYLPLFFEDTALLWDYLPADRLCITAGDLATLLEPAWQQVVERHARACGQIDRPPLDPQELNAPPARHLERQAEGAVLRLDDPVAMPGLPRPAALPALRTDPREPDPLRGLQAFLGGFTGRVLLTGESAGRRELLADMLRQRQLTATPCDGWQAFVGGDTRLGLTVAPVENGLLLPDEGLALVCERDLFADRPRMRRRQRRVRDPAQIISDLTDLHAGAPIVHAEHGVGRYQRLTTMHIDDMPVEFLTIAYAGGDLLHVPVAALHKVTRYTGASPEEAPLHRLGSDQWERARRRAAARMRDVAAELLELYARRAARRTTRSAPASDDYEAFAAAFPFELTEDQARAIDEIRADLARPQPMDRLVCGDVGFGKTEVALRAAFLSVTAGRQVAVLVPTTLLAQQHWQNFSDRFADWPVNVASLSRFRSARESRATLDGLASGAVDIVIGTHRLLQKDIRFRNLGLIIVDEEHRFGVTHKERLKALRAEADVLTLTATPIPRTLNMALGRLRDLSLITTPPASRLSIRTFVSRREPELIREACLREFKRGGQLYFVHNRIEDIDRIAGELATLVPEARIEVAHGQMPERELERIMLDFYHRRFHILVCTAIIESGLDVPSANTIIIDRADCFGLAQLHQLRGRVGRSHHQAFAYLLTPPPEALTADACKRLDAIASLEDLGSGFMLATHDMEIRGAGELLGDEQSGQISEIGFELYNDMLARTVAALEQGIEPDPDGATGSRLEINLHLPALLPDDYLPDVHLRLVHYKRIASAHDEKALRNLQVELVDRFGPLPEPARHLFALTRLRLAAEPLGLLRIEAGAHGGLVEFAAQTAVDPAWLVTLIHNEPETWRLDRDQKLRFSENLDDGAARFDFVTRLVERMLAHRLRSPLSAPPQAGR